LSLDGVVFKAVAALPAERTAVTVSHREADIDDCFAIPRRPG
jgi:hypothetical protein